MTNWTRSSLSDGIPYLTGMSHSSGIFTFPKTGVYRVDFRFGYYKSDYRRYVGALMQLTLIVGSYFDIGRSYTHLYDVDTTIHLTHLLLIVILMFKTYQHIE